MCSLTPVNCDLSMGDSYPRVHVYSQLCHLKGPLIESSGHVPFCGHYNILYGFAQGDILEARCQR